MDENKSPQDILSEIFENAKEPTPPPQRPRFEYPPEEEPLSFPLFKEVTEKSGTAQGIKVPLWLSVGLGAALLILGICVLQLVRVNDRLDSLQETISGELGSVEQLWKENESLQASRDLLRERVQKAEEGTEHLRQQVKTQDEELNNYTVQLTALDTFLLIHQLMESGDYSIAAIAVSESGSFLYTFTSSRDLMPNPMITQQFEQDQQMLVDQGYLQKWPSGFTHIDTTKKFQDENQIRTLTALWTVLHDCYCYPYSSADSTIIPIVYFDQFGGGEYTFLKENCSEFTLRLYKQAVNDFVEAGQLQWENGRLVQVFSYTDDEIVYGIHEDGFDLPDP